MFLNRQVFLNVAPGSYLVPSGTVTSAMNWARSLHVCAAALAGITAAGTSDNTSANNNIVDANLTRVFIGTSSSLHPTNLHPIYYNANLSQKFQIDYTPLVYLFFKDCSISHRSEEHTSELQSPCNL